jgi:hypothetical protein
MHTYSQNGEVVHTDTRNACAEKVNRTTQIDMSHTHIYQGTTNRKANLILHFFLFLSSCIKNIEGMKGNAPTVLCTYTILIETFHISTKTCYLQLF